MATATALDQRSGFHGALDRLPEPADVAGTVVR
jgi:hypothetical protein